MDKKRFALPQAPVSGGEGALPVAPDAGGTTLAPAPSSDTAKAGQFFGDEVERLPGVLRVEQRGGEESGAPTFHVYLLPDDRDTEYAVYEVKGQAYDRFPEAYLEVVVFEAVGAPLSNGETGT